MDSLKLYGHGRRGRDWPRKQPGAGVALGVLVALVTSLGPGVLRAAVARYSIQHLTDLTDPVAINDLGHVVGRNRIWRDGVASVMTGLGSWAYAQGINNAGQVVGYESARAFLWQDGVVTLLPAIAPGKNAYAMAINSAGDVVGYSDNIATVGITNFRATLWHRAGGTSDLGSMPGDSYSVAYAINDSGQVGCLSKPTIGGGYGENLFMADNGAIVSVVPNSGDSRIFDINNHVQIVGHLQYKAFLWENGTVTMLGDFSGSSRATAINDAGQIVGSGWLPSGNRAFLYEGGVMHDLNDLVDGLGTWVLTEAQGINEAGQIVGWGVPRLGSRGVFLLTPLPPRVRLDVVGSPASYGTPFPHGYGAHELAPGTDLTNTVTSPVSVAPGTRQVCAGWVGSGSVPAAGDATSVSFQLQEDSGITWQWSAEHWMSLDAQQGSLDAESQWVADGGSITITATPDPHHRFVQWTGDTSGCVLDGNRITAMMDRPRQLVAEFELNRYTLRYEADAGGMIVGDSVQTVEHGSAGTAVTAVPIVGYVFLRWDDGRTENPRQDTDVVADGTAVAEFLQGVPVTQGALMDIGLPGGVVPFAPPYLVSSSAPDVLSAAVGSGDRLLLDPRLPGSALLRIGGADPDTGAPREHVLALLVVGRPAVLEDAFLAHEPWNPRFRQRILLRNDSGLAGPAIGLRLLFSALQPGIVVESVTGAAPAPDGRPALEWETRLADGQTSEICVTYVSTGAFRPDLAPPAMEAQYVLAASHPLPDQGQAPTIHRIRVLEDGRVVLEFASTPGGRYRVDYRDDLPGGVWRSVPWTIEAQANRTQWIDSGPPATLAPTGTRYYRIREIPQ